MSLVEDTEVWPEIGKQIAARLDALLEGQARIEEFVKLETTAAASARGRQEHPTQYSRISFVTSHGVDERKTPMSEPSAEKQLADLEVKNVARISVSSAGSVRDRYDLHPEWPANLKMHAFKTRCSSASAEHYAERLEGRLADYLLRGRTSRAVLLHEVEAGFGGRRTDKWIRALHPYSGRRACWDQLSCLMLSYELVLLPVVLAWNIQSTGLQYTLTLVTFAFWLADLVLNFFTGFTRHGEVILSVTESVLHYLRGWFVLDFGILVSSGFSLWFAAMGSESDAASMTLLRIGKVARVLRVAGVMRMLRISESVKRLVDANAGSDLAAMTEIPALMLIMCYVSHVFACCWFGLSVHGRSDTGRAWVTSFLPGSDVPYSEVPMGHQYSTAFHWALSQMTSGAMGLQAENTNERVFNLAVLIVGVVLSSTIISRLTSKLAEYSATKSKQRHTVKTLSTYLRKFGVDRKLVIATALQVKERLLSLERSSFDPTLALQMLPLQMQSTLYYEMSSRNLCHPLFRMWSIIDGETVVSMSYMQFLTFQIFAKGDTVFQAASDTAAAYMVVQGLLKYTQTPETSLVEFAISEDVGNHSFVAEAALYCNWVHVGTAEVQQTSDVLVVHPEMVKQEIERSVVMSWVCREMAKAFHTKITTTDVLEEHPTDLTMPFASPDDIIPLLPRPAAKIVALCALHSMVASFQTSLYAAHRWKAFKHYCDQLKEEVNVGKCVLLLHADGSVERVASVVTLKLCRKDGRFLVHLASVQESAVCKVKIELPGCKAFSGEATDETVKRTMQKWLRPFAQSVDIGAMTRQTTDKVSRRSEYPLRLTYGRTCLHFAVCDTNIKSDTVVSVTSQGPLCSDLGLEDAYLLARRKPGKDEDDYSLWSWLSEDEFAHFKADDVLPKLIRALEEYDMQQSDFERASAYLFNGSRDSDLFHSFEVDVDHADSVVGEVALSGSQHFTI